MARIRTDNVFGTITNDPLTSGGTTLNSAGLANLPAISSPDYAVLTLDPNRANGAPEIIYVTAHTASAISATILRGREGTAVRQHSVGTFWVHAPSALDYALGEVAYAQVTANQTGISAETDLTGLSVTWTAIGTRLYRITGHVLIQQKTGTGTSDLKLTDGSNIEVQRFGQHELATDRVTLFEGSWRTSGLSGGVTRKLRAATSANTLDALAATTRPNFILVEDIGPNRTVQGT